MEIDSIWEDEELGRMLIKVHSRARRLIFRTHEDAIYVTVPPGTDTAEIRNAIEQLRPRLRVARQKAVAPLIDLDYRIDAEFFKLSLVGGQQRNRFISRPMPDGMQIVCPPDTDFANPELQSWLRKVIEEALRRRAKSLLPPRLEALSRRYDLPYARVRINSSSGRWGSCSARKYINLSYYLLLLPARLIDYVLLHELAHTREMNHGDRFWALLNRLTAGKAQDLRRELKQYRTTF